ncbi:MAG: DUF2933 domain-containing protein [Rhizobiales bacterium]|nr:DUF2933 domain-containing protein [Hyphomicrobiales bacterium]
MSNCPHDHSPMAGRAKFAWIVFAAIAAFYLLSEHRARTPALWPW